MLQVYNKRTKYPLSFQRLFKAKYDSEYEELEQEPESEVVEEDTESPSEDQPAQLSFASFTDLDYPIAE